MIYQPAPKTHPDKIALQNALGCISAYISNPLPAEVVEHAFETGLLSRPRYYTAERTIARYVRIVELMMQGK